jgi:cytoskeletal protein RodZ
MHSNSLAARLGRWSTEHRTKAIVGWFAFVVVAVVIGSATGMVNPTNSDSSTTGDSKVADQIVNDAYPDKGSESVIVQSTGKSSFRDPEFRRTVDDVIAGVDGKPGVQKIESPYAKGNKGQISADGRSALVTFEIRGDETLLEKRIDAIEAGVDTAAAKHPGLYVGQFGDASANKELSKGFEDDFKKAGTL